MKINANQNTQVEELNNDKPLFDDDINYETPSEDRPYIFMVGKKPIFVNLEQLKFLRKDYWQEKTDNWLKSRCLIPAERGDLKVCRADCSKCPKFLQWKTQPTFVSLSDMDEEEYIADHHQESPLDALIREEERRLMYEAIDNLEDPIDRFVMRQYLAGKTDNEVGDMLGKTRQTIINRRKNCIIKMKIYLKIE